MPYKDKEKSAEYKRAWAKANPEKVEASRKRRVPNLEKRREARRKRYAANSEKDREARREWYAANSEKARESRREWYAANSEKACESAREWYAANLEEARERTRKWKAANPEQAREARRKWRAANPEQARELSRKWRAENPEKVVAAKSARRARVRKAPIWADQDLIRDLYALAKIYRDAGFPCHVDHIVPLRGKTVSGLHVHNNLTVLPARDNLAKGNRTWPDIP